MLFCRTTSFTSYMNRVPCIYGWRWQPRQAAISLRNTNRNWSTNGRERRRLKGAAGEKRTGVIAGDFRSPRRDSLAAASCESFRLDYAAPRCRQDVPSFPKTSGKANLSSRHSPSYFAHLYLKSILHCNFLRQHFQPFSLNLVLPSVVKPSGAIAKRGTRHLT